jgi:hypothetical protein
VTTELRGTAPVLRIFGVALIDPFGNQVRFVEGRVT